METVAGRLRSLLQGVVDEFAPLMRTIPLSKFENDPESSIVFITAFPWFWTDISEEQRGQQIRVLRRYERFADVMRLLVHRVPEAVANEWADANEQMRGWLELHSENAHLSGDAARNEQQLRQAAAAIDKVLRAVEASGDTGVFVVPDTNSVVWQPDPAKYRAIAGADAFTFVLLPTVLGELDALKTNDRKNENVRGKARAAVSRISGWMNQAARHGSALADGVIVDRSITVIAPHTEPNMRETLRWLDAAVPDDRIVASVLALQAEHPAARFILVTGDINLRNKAGAALIETATVPDAE